MRNSDLTGTHEYTELSITRNSLQEVEEELTGQISAGIFENCRVGDVKIVQETILYKVTANHGGGPMSYYYDTPEKAAAARRRLSNGDVEKVVVAHDDDLNYHDGCLWNELTLDRQIRTEWVSEEIGDWTTLS